jgi:hypothetical protein
LTGEFLGIHRVERVLVLKLGQQNVQKLLLKVVRLLLGVAGLGIRLRVAAVYDSFGSGRVRGGSRGYDSHGSDRSVIHQQLNGGDRKMGRENQNIFL